MLISTQVLALFKSQDSQQSQTMNKIDGLLFFWSEAQQRPIYCTANLKSLETFLIITK